MLVPSVFKRNDVMDDLFEDMFPMNFREDKMLNNKMMSTDVKEFKDKFELDLELPGFNKNDIKAEVKDGYLIVNASHNENKDEKNAEGKFIRRERYTGKCQRSFYIGDNIRQDEIKASFENGILRLNVPKKREEPKVEQKSYIAIEGK